MSVRRRGKKFIVRVYDVKLGEAVWVGTYPTQREAKDAEAEHRLEAKASRRYLETVEGFGNSWVQTYPRQRESTNRHNARTIRPFIDEFGTRKMGDIDRVEARRWALVNRSKVPSVRAMFTDAVRDEVCRRNPFVGLGLQASRGRRDLVVPTAAELDRLVVEARRLHGPYGVAVYANLIQFAAYSGLRPGEMAGLRWTDIDTAGRTVTVARQFSHATREFGPTKNGLTRVVFLTPQAQDALERTAHVGVQVFTTPKGGVLHGSTASTYFRPVARSIGRPELTPHCLRHYYGTHLALLGLGPVEIAQALGHTDGGKLAMATYVHVTERDARDKIAAAFRSNVRDLKVVEGREAQ